jgi:hypothetical protein
MNYKINLKVIRHILSIIFVLVVLPHICMAQSGDWFYDKLIEKVKSKEPNYKMLNSSVARDLQFDDSESISYKVELSIFTWKSKNTNEIVKVLLGRSRSENESTKLFEDYKNSDLEKGVTIQVTNKIKENFDEVFLTKREKEYSLLARRKDANLVVTSKSPEVLYRFVEYFAELVL